MTTAFNTGIGGAISPLGIPGTTSYKGPIQVTMTDSVFVHPGITLASRSGSSIAENLQVADGDVVRVDRRYSITSVLGVGIAPAAIYAFRPGAIISDVVRVQQAQATKMTYTWTVAEQVFMAQALGLAAPVMLADGIGVALATRVSLGVALLQGIGMAPTPLPSLKYVQTLVATIAMSPHLDVFFGASLADGIGAHTDLSTMYSAKATLADGVGIAPAFGTHLLMAVTVNDSINISPSEALHAIYNGQLADGVEIVVGYVTPSGNFSTWAMNTRSAAVTEYSNYEFNSFAQLGDVYYGASSSGLYKLVGDDDNGTSIIADLKSGFAEWAGSKYTLLRGVYLAARGGGDYVLKLINGDGLTYIYAVAAKSQATTKVTVGKGLRARYWRFELISTGQDFDLDSLEFVPLISDRRV